MWWLSLSGKKTANVGCLVIAEAEAPMKNLGNEGTNGIVLVKDNAIEMKV